MQTISHPVSRARSYMFEPQHPKDTHAFIQVNLYHPLQSRKLSETRFGRTRLDYHRAIQNNVTVQSRASFRLLEPSASGFRFRLVSAFSLVDLSLAWRYFWHPPQTISLKCPEPTYSAHPLLPFGIGSVHSIVKVQSNLLLIISYHRVLLLSRGFVRFKVVFTTF